MQHHTFKTMPRLLVLALIAGSNSFQAMAEQTPVDFGETILSTVKVEAAAESDTRPVQGYQAKKSTAATRTDTGLIDVPQSVTVITQEVMKDQSVQSVSDAVRYVPGVTASQGEGNRDAINFRGAGVTTGDFYLDGVREDIQTYRDFYNTDRVEVLKGPNGMIFGRGAAGGAVNRVSKEAGWDPVRELKVSAGAYSHQRVTLDLGDAINEIAAFRVNAVAEDSGSYRDGVETGRHGITPTITLMPTEQTRITLGYEYFKDAHIGDRGVPSVNGPGNGRLGNRPFRIGDEDAFFGNARLSPNETEINAFNALIEHTFNNGLTVRNRTRFADYDKFYQNVFARGPLQNDGTVELGAYLDRTGRENLINQTDLLYAFKFGGVEHKLLAGLELGRQDTHNMRFQQAGGGESLGFFDASDPRFNGDITFSNINRNRKSEASITAFYVQDQIVLSPAWEAVIGVRHDRFDVRHTGLPVTGNNAVTHLAVTDKLLSPRAGLIFKPMQNLSLYGSYSLTWVPRAGDQLDGLTLTNASFDPEKFISQEIGAKWDATPELSLTAAIYRLQRENMAVADPLNPAQTILVDGQETRGVELGISGKVTGKWRVFGGYAYQDAEITEQFISSGEMVRAGSPPAQTPEHTFSLWNRYDFDARWGAALGIVSRSAMFAALPTVNTSTLLPGYTRYDAAIYGKLSSKLQLQVNLENLTGKEYALNAHNNNNITPGSPFSARATLTYSF